MHRNEETGWTGAAPRDHYDSSHRSTRWFRVTNRDRCPICGRQTWCRVSGDRGIAGCMRLDRGAYRTVNTRLGTMYLHHLRGNRSPSPSSRASWFTTPQVSIAAAPVEHRQAVYVTILGALTLTGAHSHYLRGDKGMTEETVTRNFYATVPSDAAMADMCRRLAAVHDLTAVPGFYSARNRWRFIAGPGELLIPVRDRAERIVAILRRTGGKPKYRFASSSTAGASCGAPLHWSLPYLAELYPSDPIIVTEGVLKADVIAERLHCAVVGLPGVASLGGIDTELLDWLAGRRVQIAFDADERHNPHVRASLARLARMLATAGIKVDVLRWNERNGKGLDDVLIGGVA